MTHTNTQCTFILLQHLPIHSKHTSKIFKHRLTQQPEATGDEYLQHSTSHAAQSLGVFGMFGVGAQGGSGGHIENNCC